MTSLTTINAWREALRQRARKWGDAGMPRRNPSTRWFFRDWEGDEALRLCSMAAQGLWMRMLCICAENDGYLLIRGESPTLTVFTRLVGCTSPKMLSGWIAELERNGVFSRTEQGVIYNRRMVRENGSNGAEKTDDSRAHVRRAPAHVSRPRPQGRPERHARPFYSSIKENPSSLESQSVAARDRQALGMAAPARDDVNGSWQSIGSLLNHQPATTPPSHDERVQAHLEYLKAHDADGFSLYLESQMGDDPDAAQRMFELIELRMNDQQGAAA